MCLSTCIHTQYAYPHAYVHMHIHTHSVLYLAMSPDGQTIVTGAGDETLRFWSAFPGSAKTSDGSRLAGVGSLLFPSGHDIR